LSDSLARLDPDGLLSICVQQQHQDLAAVAGVDQSWRVDQRNPVARSEAGARHHEHSVSRRNLERDPGSY